MAEPDNGASGLAKLLSLSQAASIVPPIGGQAKQEPTSAPKVNGHGLKHRRLSSTGQARRRLSDARDATTRPTPASLHSAATALASLSLTSAAAATTTGFATMPQSATGDFSAVQPIAITNPSSRRMDDGLLSSSVPTGLHSTDNDVDVDVEADVDIEDDQPPLKEDAKNGKAGRTGKRRGTIFKCESCSKVYRHPSCLVKHRWEHSPHWREASKFLLSKHQQVQLLEAAAILSHLAPGTSLPEDRSLWPSYLSGGLLPPPANAKLPVSGSPAAGHGVVVPKGSAIIHPVSSSVPAPSISPIATRARSREAAAASGPRMHNYTLPGGGGVGITQIRPGILISAGSGTKAGTNGDVVLSPYANEQDASVKEEVQDPTPASTGVPIQSAFATSMPMAVPTNGHYRDRTVHYGSYGDPGSASASLSLSHSLGAGGWSLPRSSIRSGSLSYSESRSRSGSRSDDEEESSDEVEDNTSYNRYDYKVNGYRHSSAAWREEDDVSNYSIREDYDEDNYDSKSQKHEQEEEWDGMDMDMEL